MEMNIEDIKPRWQSARQAINPGQEFDNRRRTSLQRLADRYRRFALLALVLTGVNIPALIQFCSLECIVGFVLIMLASSAMDFYLMLCIRSIDPSAMPVHDVLFRIMDCRRKHLTFVAVALPCVFLWCAYLGYSHRLDVYFLGGIVSGGMIGLAIGIRMLLRFLDDYRAALEE